MTRLFGSALGLLQAFGVDPLRAILAIRGLPYYLRCLQLLRKQKRSSPKDFSFGRPYLCLTDRFSESGEARGHYFHQDLLVARRLYLRSPAVHVDVGSSIAGFVAHVATFRLVEVFDIRPQHSAVPNVRFVQADLMAPLSDALVNYCDSISCLHAVEHFGLGRYGDPVNYNGHLVGLDNLYRILKKDGTFYFSVPIGPQRIEFNAHRVFSVGYLLQCFADRYQLDQFSFVDDRGDLHEDVPITTTSVQDNFGCTYGCGVLEMTKR